MFDSVNTALTIVHRRPANKPCTYRTRSMEHANAKVPEQKPAVFANAAKPVVPLVATPWIECDCCYP